MPGAFNTLERPKMTRVMYQALKRHIMKEREKKKQEQEQDKQMERMRKEREMKKKKEEEDSLTLEQTKEQISGLEKQLETLKQQKHDLFSQLKKVLHQEDESKREQKQREQSEIMQNMHQQYGAVAGMVSGHPAMFLQTGMVRQSSKYLNPMPPQPQVAGIKRRRSPSPTPTPGTMYAYSGGAGGKYPATTYATTVKQEGPYAQHPKTPGSYTGQSTHVTYVSQAGHTYQPPTSYPSSQAASSTKYPAGQSAFSSYPSHYAHQQRGMPEYHQAGYPVTRKPQQGKPYLGSPHAGSNIPLHQQLEHANQKSGFSEEKLKMQQVKTMRGITPIQSQPGQVITQHPSQHSSLPQHQAPPTSQAQPPKGGIMSGYPVRTQASSSPYQPASQVKTAHSSPQGAPRHGYNPQQYSRY